MIKYRFVLLFFLFPVFAFPQKISSLVEFEKLLKLNTDRISNAVNLQKGVTYLFQEEWDSTLVYTAKQLLLPEQSQELKNYCYFLRGYSFKQKKIFDEAAKELNKVSIDFTFPYILLNYKGKVALEQKDFKKALRYFKQIDLDSLPSYLSKEYIDILENIGIVNLHLEKHEEAEKYLEKSIQEREKIGDTIELVGGYSNIANLYYSKYLDDTAISYFLKAYDLSQHTNNYNLLRVAAKNMAVVEENRKDYVKALKYRKEYEQWKDSLNDQNRIYETAQLEKKIAVEKKEQEVQLLEAENKAAEAQNRVYLFSGISVFALLVIVFISYRGTAKRNKIITAQKEDLDQLNTTKDKLFSIVSHDLRSSVNAIKTSNKKLLGNLATQNKKEISQNLQENSSIVNGAYRLLDNLLNWALLQTQQSYFEMTELSLSRIVDHVAYNYQPILEEKEIGYINSVAKKEQVQVDQESLKIILRNLMDNAIKFTKEKGSIHIYTEEMENSYVNLVVEDSGIGMDEETLKELLKDHQLLSKKKHEDIIGTGLGLHLVKSMVARNQGQFHIESEEGKGTKMIISLLQSQNS